MAYAVKHQAQVTATSSLDIVAGCWLFISPFFLPVLRNNSAAVANTVCVGVAVAFLAAWHLLRPVRANWASWVNIALGVWLFVSPWLLRFFGMNSATLNSMLMGVVVVLIAGWSSIATHERSESNSH